MAPPPEYDKEPKAPDKSATNISTEDSKLLHNLVNDQHTNSDHKSANTVTAVEVENKKHVETLDDGQLKALLDEAINYKNPKDREGKSKIFKELLEEVEQESDEQASSAARALGGGRGARRTRRGPPLAHSNSLQDLVAALAAEPPRRHHARHTPAPPATSVSARAHHGGSLPSGVDTSSLSEEPARGAGYLATVRCVNPPPLAERRVSASDANTPAEMELLNRRSKPMFPMTYTARATLEIGSGAVCSGRAVTTTTASNQVRTPASARQVSTDSQSKLMNALCARPEARQGGGRDTVPLRHCRDGTESASIGDLTGKTNIPRGPMQPDSCAVKHEDTSCRSKETEIKPRKGKGYLQKCTQSWVENVDNWYKSLPNYSEPLKTIYSESFKNKNVNVDEFNRVQENKNRKRNENKPVTVSSEVTLSEETELRKKKKIAMDNKKSFSPKHTRSQIESLVHLNTSEKDKEDTSPVTDYSKYELNISEGRVKKYDLVVPTLSDVNPKNVRPMSIGQPQVPVGSDFNKNNTVEVAENNIQEAINPVDINSNTVDVEDKQTEDIENSSDADHYDNKTLQCTECCGCDVSKKREQLNELIDMFNRLSAYADADREIELQELKSNGQQDKNRGESFSKYVALQQKLIFEIASLQAEISHQHTVSSSSTESDNNVHEPSIDDPSNNINTPYTTIIKNKEPTDSKQLTSIPEESEIVNQVCSVEDQRNIVTSDSDCTANISNNAYVLLTIPSSNNTESFVSETPSKPKTGKKKENLSLAPSHTNKKEDALNKNILKVLLFENLFKNNNNEKSGIPGVSSITNDEVDSAISFSCITTPEVVASCNTTSSTSQSAVAVDPKPRSVISNNFNGLPLSRPNYGSTGTSATATEDYKKTTDENGNSVQGFSSPLSGSSQHKKPRRKKTSKNETVIDCQLMDGYQGDKDVNELLRFIESNADNGRAGKLPRVKHKDDSDDKGGKKRSAERRKDKENKIKRATSMEELSRTKIEDLTDAEAPLRDKERRDLAAAKPERRSWGDDSRDNYEPPAAELTDFQTVTKKRKPRRRADEPEREPPRRTRPPSPRRRESAPPSERSNDSNDDLDSVHSLPGAPPPAPPAASYADIARTRHNIPDLIESCNFYAEGDALPRRAAPDDYPALRRRPAKPARARKLRGRAPDVLAHRPPVVLRAPPAPGMDGVTFGFDVNEQLLRPRDLRYVPPAPPPDAALLLQLVDYVGAAWEDVLRCGAGKVRYFSE